MKNDDDDKKKKEKRNGEVTLCSQSSIELLDLLILWCKCACIQFQCFLHLDSSVVDISSYFSFHSYRSQNSHTHNFTWNTYSCCCCCLVSLFSQPNQTETRTYNFKITFSDQFSANKLIQSLNKTTKIKERVQRSERNYRELSKSLIWLLSVHHLMRSRAHTLTRSIYRIHPMVVFFSVGVFFVSFFLPRCAIQSFVILRNQLTLFLLTGFGVRSRLVSSVRL